MIWKRFEFWAGSGKKSALKLRWRRAADCSRGGSQPSKMHDRQQWTAVFVGSPAVRMTMTGDGGRWNRRHAGCSRKDTVAPDHAGIGKRAQPTLKLMHSGDRSQWRSCQHRYDVLILRLMCQYGGGVEHRPKWRELWCRKSCECCVAVVKLWLLNGSI